MDNAWIIAFSLKSAPQDTKSPRIKMRGENPRVRVPEDMISKIQKNKIYLRTARNR